MQFFPHLGELGSSAVHLALIAGITAILPTFVDRNNNTHRAILYSIAGLLALRYIWWRATDTLAPPGLTLDFVASTLLFTLELLALVGSISAFVIMSRIRHRSDEVDENIHWWWGQGEPRVAILIATYNEELDVLERTIVGAKSLRHLNKEVIVLDDSRRDWLRDYCAEQGVRYMRRPDNKGAKAGNINHALDRLAEDPVQPDFVAVLDADFVPHRGFLSRTLALFHNPKVGLVQTPQHFFNPDPIQHNLGLVRSYPDEQRFFFDYLQPSRDAWGIAICCGTSSICRWSALREIGGFSTESVTEDFMLSMVLENHGYETVYLGEALTEGLAPEGLKEYITQRARWCLGLMQIVRSSLGPFRRNKLSWRHRWSTIDSFLYWSTSFLFRISAIVFPLMYWFFNTIVVDAQLTDVITYFGCYWLWVVFTMNFLSGGILLPVLHDVSQLIGSIHISRAAMAGIFKPKGHKFSVTAKGGDRSRIVVQWELMAPFLVAFVLTLLGLTLGIFSDSFAYNDAGDGKWVIVFWSIYNLIVLGVTCLACIELPRVEVHVADKPERVTFRTEGAEWSLWITSLTMDTVRLRGAVVPEGARGTLEIEGVPGEVSAYVIAPTGDGARVQLLPDEAQREAFFVRFYAEGNAPGVGSVRGAALLGDLIERFAITSR